jgi:hypothetical protein
MKKIMFLAAMLFAFTSICPAQGNPVNGYGNGYVINTGNGEMRAGSGISGNGDIINERDK